MTPEDIAKLEQIPATYQSITEFFSRFGDANPFLLRNETFIRIERITGRPLICYVSKTYNLPEGVAAYIDDSDLTGFGDLIQSISNENVDVLIISNGGSAEATERIVNLLRDSFKEIRFIIPANAYSAATLMCFAADEVIIDIAGTLGPIDPQIQGVPARAILRAFETIEKRLKEEGPLALSAYIPLISKFDLHILEICKSAQDLSKELAKKWLSSYMLKCPDDDPRVKKVIDYFSDYDAHKSHGRSIDRKKAKELGLNVLFVEEIKGMADLIRSIKNQYELWFDKTPFFKVYENSHGINWGKQSQTIKLQFPAITPPGPPMPQLPIKPSQS